MNIPNMLTMARIAMVPVLVGMIYMPEHMLSKGMAQAVAMAIFVLAALTDWLDGYLARALKQTSKFGAFIDPVADKVMVCASLILLVHMGRLHSVAAMVIIGREITVSALREWMATMGQRNVVQVAMLGKLKTTAQMVAIPFLLVDLKFGGWMGTVEIGTALMWVAVVLTVWSMVEYMRSAMRALKGGDSVVKQQAGGLANIGGSTVKL
jgi:CDP-diacylglycerol--glycerol-3-phosphate 3-phosphatidyltransferase